MKATAHFLLFFFAFSFLLFFHSKTESTQKIQSKYVLDDNSEDTIEIQIDQEDSIPDEQNGLDVDEILRIYNELKGKESDSARDVYYFELIKSFEIFSAAYRELLKNYVIPIPPFELVKYALEGITRQLDPYTNFFSNEQELDEAVISKEYIGLGIVVMVIDSSLMVVDFLDSLAKDISGLKLGDKIIFIDSVKIAPNLDTLRAYTSGKENSRIELVVRREGVDTLMRIVTFRRKIEIPDVSFSKIFDLDNGKAIYINVEHFNPEMPETVRNILRPFVELKPQDRKGIIIDLRDNPGGTLESAIQLCEMFLPSGATIVSTRGRGEDEEKTYKAVIAPIDTSTPLIVLVNNGSASASEIVAGAIQDNDRGVILGEKTFGKGIIQSIAVLPYDSYLKITTAKYFTPSGRSIHRNRYLSSASGKIGKLYTTDTVFYTKNGRVVKESNGIQPDIEIKKKENNSFVDFLKSKALFIRFVSALENRQKVDLQMLENKPKLLNDFIGFLDHNKVDYKYWFEHALDSIFVALEKDKSMSVLAKKLKNVKAEIHKPIEKLVKENSKEILEEIENEIERRIVSYYEYRFYVLQQDDYFKESLSLLKNKKKYLEILGVGSN